KLELAQYRELAAFAQFGSDLDARTKAQLDRGARIVEIFKQPIYSPIPVEQQVTVLWGIQNGFFDGVDVKKIVDANASVREFFTTRKTSILDSIRTKQAVTDEIAAELKKAFEEWKIAFSG